MIAETTSLSDLIAENAQQKSMIEEFRNQNCYLKEQLAWLARQLFGQRSEKFVDGLNEKPLLLPGFQPPKEPEKKKKIIPAHERRQPQRSGKDKITLAPDLPIERQIIDLPGDRTGINQDRGRSD